MGAENKESTEDYAKEIAKKIDAATKIESSSGVASETANNDSAGKSSAEDSLSAQGDSIQNYDERQLVVFKLGNEEFGVDIMDVREIIRIEAITKIPNSEGYVHGVINLRGGIIVVLSLAKKLGLPDKEFDKNTRIIIIEKDNNQIGLVVDSATEVMRLSGEYIKPAPSIIVKKVNADYLDAVGVIGERLLILLNLGRLVISKETLDEIESIKNVKDPSPDVNSAEVANVTK